MDKLVLSCKQSQRRTDSTENLFVINRCRLPNIGKEIKQTMRHKFGAKITTMNLTTRLWKQKQAVSQ